MSTPSFFKTHPRVCALVLATTKGSRLFPITSTDMPKHMLPIAGIPSIIRLLESLAYLPQVVVAISADDSVTLALLKSELGGKDPSQVVVDDSNVTSISVNEGPQTLTVVRLSSDCFGPADALREVEATKIVHPSTRLVVLPGDLVFLQKNVNLDPLLRPPSESDSIILLVDVGEVDEHGIPLKESAKAKKGGLARDEEDLEYIGLSYPLPSGLMEKSARPNLPRVILKQSKMDVEADEDMTGSTAKLEVPKSRLRHGKLMVQLSWDDVHVYSLAPWTRELLQARKGLSSLQEDLLPLLIARQFRGKRATFGKSLEEKLGENEEKENTQAPQMDDSPYFVGAVVLAARTVVRVNTISAIHFACREAVVNGADLTMPRESKWNGKFQTLVLKDSTLGAKISMKSTVVGESCELGAKCKLNNVVIMDNVTIGENCSLQNTVIGPGAKLGNNCSLNDCQVGPGKEIEAGTKEKGESFMVGDAIVEDLL